MKTKKLFSILCIALMVVGAVSTTGCKKYEDGPAISLRSRTERVANTWKIDQAFDNGNDVTSEYDQYELYLAEGGYAKLTATYSYGTFIFSGSTEGTWTFQTDETHIKMDFEDDDADATYKILRLKENEMWLEEPGNGRELHLIPR